MSRKTKTLLTVGFAIICVALAFGWSYPFPKRIEVSYPAVEFRNGDSSSVSQTTVTINGTLSRPLFRDKYFNGKITVDGYDYTSSYDLSEVTFNQDVNNGEGYLVYFTYAEGHPILTTFGSLWQKGDFDEVRIAVYEPADGNGKSMTDRMVAAPASKYEEAQAIADQAANGK